MSPGEIRVLLVIGRESLLSHSSFGVREGQVTFITSALAKQQESLKMQGMNNGIILNRGVFLRFLGKEQERQTFGV
ncbi:hypothetical protein [Anaerolinea thermophila]|uniref:hypothetical protein n=1 Tax=Anaerolinea thermophila TaxID=167964 RepID=UPI000674B14A|nr:hypothetical protein [Anaerolinea thermophila]